MESIIQIHNVTKSEFISIIENVIDERLKTALKSKEPENLTIKETAKLLKVSEQSVHNYLKRGLLKAQKVGRILLVKRTSIENSLQDVKSLKYRRDV